MEARNNNTRERIIKALDELGKIMQALGEEKPYGSCSKLLNEAEYESLNQLINKEHVFNGWFTSQSIRQAYAAIGELLSVENITAWITQYDWTENPKKVGVIMAGNIPLVGFHDFLCVLLSGHHASIKLSSNDQRLLPSLLNVFALFLPELFERVKIVPQLKDIEAIIATGSNNSSLYFERYFGHLPHIIRKNRTSVAILTGSETTDELKGIGKDVFQYFGLGCRNVSKLLMLEKFDINRFFEAVFPYQAIINHHKYANNYDYYKAIYLMNQLPILENGFLLTLDNEDLFAPISVVYTQRFSDENAIKDYLKKEEDNIQVVVGQNYTPFGKAQHPTLSDYADGVDTMQFLNQL